MSSTIIRKDTIHRLISDIKYIRNNPLHNEGIYYEHDDEHMLKGYAMIVGPSQTPYENGLFFFTFEFPTDYPHSPPKMTYITNDGTTRFNPNLYRSGKVCLSLLNTWRGEQWTSCQNIASILLTLVSIFNNNPLMNEPGIVAECEDIPIYNKIISYKTMDVSIYGLIDRMMKSELSESELKFEDNIKEHILKHRMQMLEFVKAIKRDSEDEYLQTSIYQMKVHLDYNNLYAKIKNINLKKLK